MNTLMPAVGSNQHLVKFDSDTKTKKKTKKRSKVEFVTKVKIALVFMLLASLYTNWLVIRANYVFRCSAGGMLMAQSKCDELSENQMAAQEVSRLEMVKDNPDLFQN